jgi:hypothetical protein
VNPAGSFLSPFGGRVRPPFHPFTPRWKASPLKPGLTGFNRVKPISEPSRHLKVKEARSRGSRSGGTGRFLRTGA